MTLKEKMAYVRGFADADGYISKPNKYRLIQLINTNYTLIILLKKYLDELGIESRISKHKPYNKRHNDFYKIHISRSRNLKLWHELIGFNHPKKQKRLEKGLEIYKSLKFDWWSPKERRDTLKMKNEGKSIKEIAKKYERSIEATKSILKRERKGGGKP